MNNSAKPISMDALPEPPTASVRPYPHHCRDLALQKYLLLHEQHESLRQHLDELREPRQNSVCTPVSPSPATSPTRAGPSPDAARREPYSFSLPARNGSYPLSAGAARGVAASAEVAIEEAKLCDVNEGMKRALTELLNCQSVRSDDAFRTWVQCRLMDTERELRSGRRRRSAPGQ
ncbi:35a43682-5883-4a09-8e48-b1f0b2bfa6ea [Thermothielavioides terrestris]|uniref:Uncharacterized protein n=2 Tax=Thermothielavioides terrestris TaxID=2587410 RepID=G2QUF9_THETT|nr:uncharacterized protein THITE_2109251 [Thermothielavioides terrestris NRRL 8126]AEO63711.1 hypothetical protein THITE_2109251 [Thermothielavioides terrestris NRRL 8126]SPQ20786.1 35a43682-5883-4a09-8e48-b1f0b2bfa6ea [Thermothielavioides terrestris]